MKRQLGSRPPLAILRSVGVNRELAVLHAKRDLVAERWPITCADTFRVDEADELQIAYAADHALTTGNFLQIINA